MSRVTRADDALYSTPRKSRKRRRCDGHLAEPHWINEGDMAIWSALPPDSEYGNTDWWHLVLCLNCAPESTLTPEES